MPPPALPALGDDESQRLQNHIVSPAASTERLQAIQQLVAEHIGENRPDFRDNVLRAIPVQAGGLFPITDVWHIEPGLDMPNGLRTHIAQFAREIAEEAQLADCIGALDAGLGFVCHAPRSPALPPFGQAVLSLLQAIGHGTEPLAGMRRDSFPLETAFGSLLLGSAPGAVATMPRLSDTGLVKLFRLLRLARRLLDLEADARDASSG